MGISNLLNKKCSWRRRINSGVNDYNEIVYSDIVYGSDVNCARQVGHGNNMRQFLEKNPGDFNYKIVKYFLLPTDIQEGDLITFEGSETEIVRDVRDAAGRGHHVEVLAESVRSIGEDDKRNT